MRIAIVARSAARIGGVETYLAGIIPALSTRHTVGCWFETGAGNHEPILPDTWRGPVSIRSWEEPEALGALNAWRPDVVYLHGLQSAVSERRLLAAGPVVLLAHSYYGACISGEKATRFPVQAPCDRVLGPACLARYFPQRCGGLSPVTMMRQYERQRQKQQLLRDYAAVVVGSSHMARHYAAHGVSARVLHLPVAAAAPQTTERKRHRASLLFLGRLERSKGITVALQGCAAAAALLGRPVHLLVGGHGTLAQACAREARALVAAHSGLTIEFAGWISAADRAAALARTDVLLFPSLWPEPFGLTGVEAGAAGVPAIAFDVGGVGEWLTDRVNGRLLPLTGDPVGSLGWAIVDTLRDPESLEIMRLEARTAAGRFTMPAHLTALEEVLAQAAHGGSRQAVHA